MKIRDVKEGYTVLPPMNRDRYQERPGLEGPFPTRSGKVVYYDPKEGEYYDPDSDMYLTYDEWKALDNEGSEPAREAREVVTKDMGMISKKNFKRRPTDEAGPTRLKPNASARAYTDQMDTAHGQIYGGTQKPPASLMKALRDEEAERRKQKTQEATMGSGTTYLVVPRTNGSVDLTQWSIVNWGGNEPLNLRKVLTQHTKGLGWEHYDVFTQWNGDIDVAIADAKKQADRYESRKKEFPAQYWDNKKAVEKLKDAKELMADSDEAGGEIEEARDPVFAINKFLNDKTAKEEQRARHGERLRKERDARLAQDEQPLEEETDSIAPGDYVAVRSEWERKFSKHDFNKVLRTGFDKVEVEYRTPEGKRGVKVVSIDNVKKLDGKPLAPLEEETGGRKIDLGNEYRVYAEIAQDPRSGEYVVTWKYKEDDERHSALQIKGFKQAVALAKKWIPSKSEDFRTPFRKNKPLEEAVEKIACLECDAVSTRKAWQKNHGSCPKCNNSTRGVAEDKKVGDTIKSRNIKSKRSRSEKVRSVSKDQHGQNKYELDSGRIVYDQDIEEAHGTSDAYLYWSRIIRNPKYADMLDDISANIKYNEVLTHNEKSDLQSAIARAQQGPTVGEASYSDSGYRNMHKADRKASKQADKDREKQLAAQKKSTPVKEVSAEKLKKYKKAAQNDLDGLEDELDFMGDDDELIPRRRKGIATANKKLRRKAVDSDREARLQSQKESTPVKEAMPNMGKKVIIGQKGKKVGEFTVPANARMHHIDQELRQVKGLSLGEFERTQVARDLAAGKVAKAGTFAFKVADNRPKEMESVKENTAQFTVGDKVIALKGPHKGDVHEVIHCFDDGSCNIKPLTHRVKYRMGAAKAMPADIKPADNRPKEMESVSEVTWGTGYNPDKAAAKKARATSEFEIEFAQSAKLRNELKKMGAELKGNAYYVDGKAVAFAISDVSPDGGRWHKIVMND